MKFLNFDTQLEIFIPSEYEIYEDDTIEVVWYKLSKILSVDIHDIYLFTTKRASYTPEQIFQHFKGTIPWYDFNNFINNFQSIYKVEERDQTMDDIVTYDFSNVLEDVSLGKKLKCAVNPKHAVKLDIYSEADVIHESKKLLLDYMPFFEIQVYLKKSESIYFNYGIDVDSIERRLMHLNDMYKLPQPVPLRKGIKNIVCSVHPSNKIVVPLTTLFNLLHTSESLLMIQHNSGKEDTIVYKLYCEQEDIKGNRIPNLSENAVVKKDQSYKKSITAIFSNRVKYAFKEDGSIILEADCENYTVDQVNALLKSHRDVLEQLYTFMKQSGFLDYPIFTTIYESHIHNITYSMTFNAGNYKENICGNRFFVSLKDSEKRYIRVSNYNENKLIHELCVNEYLKDNLDSVKTILKHAFNLSEDDAISYVKAFNESADIALKKENLAFKIKEIIGFPTRLEKANTEITVILSNIKSAYYIPCVETNISTYIALCTEKHSIQCERDLPPKQQPKLNFNKFLTDFESDDEPDIEVESESDSDDDIVVESDDDTVGGTVDKDKDMKLNNVNFIIYRIKQKFGDKLHPEYTKKCQLHRCPIALSDKESSDPSIAKLDTLMYNDTTYICPKYWDMVNKIPLTDKEIEEQGLKIIDAKALKGQVLDVKKHGSVYKLNDGEYPFPGLLENEIGPCCFKKNKDRDSKKPRNISSSQRINTNRTNPLFKGEGAIAYLPQSIQYFFELNESCVIDKGRHLLRYAIKDPHSFVECIGGCLRMADPTYDLQKTCNLLLKASKPVFTKLNNGRLCKQFSWKEFEKQIAYLDYTYLWEIINLVFKTNLVIFRVPSLKELEIVCPSNRYMQHNFNEKTVFMILEHNENGRILFEPLIDHNISQNSHSYLHSFTDITYPLHDSFLKLKEYFVACKAKSGFYSTNVISSELQTLCKDEKIIGQVIHHEMCIGLNVNGIFVPCYPSVPLSIDKVDMPLKSYKVTVDKLSSLSKKCPCNPVYKVVEHEEIIGILTEANSFVPCIKTPNVATTLPLYPSRVIHEYSNLADEVDQQRIDFIKNMTFDKNIHSTLRLMLKTLLAKNYTLRKEVNSRIQSKTITESYVKELLEGKYEMVDASDEYIKEINQCKGACLLPILKIPNHVHGKPTNYFFKLSQELNKNSRISAFIIKPQLLIPDISYFLHDHEIVLLSEMVSSYYEHLQEPKRLPQYTTYDNAGIHSMFTKLYYITL